MEKQKDKTEKALKEITTLELALLFVLCLAPSFLWMMFFIFPSTLGLLNAYAFSFFSPLMALLIATMAELIKKLVRLKAKK